MTVSVSLPIDVEQVVTQNITADDTCPALIIKCINDTSTFDDPTIGIATTSITFYADYANTEKDETIGTAGVIDLDAAAYDTVAEFCAVVNASANWRAWPVGALPDDKLADSGLKVLAITAGTATTGDLVATEQGCPIYWDTSAVKHHTVAIGPEAMTYLDAPFYARRSDGDSLATVDITDMDSKQERQFRGGDKVAFIDRIVSNNTHDSASPVKLYWVNYLTQMRSEAIGSGGQNSVQVETDLDPVRFGAPGERLVVRYSTAGTFTSATLSVSGGFGSAKH